MTNDTTKDREPVTIKKTTHQRPSQYRVAILNDDFTPMDFVVVVLTDLCRKSIEDATEIMMKVHMEGIGIVGEYSYEIAEHMVTECNSTAIRHEYPMKMFLEKVETE